MRHAQTTAGHSDHAPFEVVRGTNQSGMRAHNERLVLTLIRQKGPMAKSEIARISGLSAQTVSVIMRALEADGLLQKGTPIRGKVGQPSVPMGLAAEGAFFLGLKVGRRSLDMILTDFLGQIISRVHLTHRIPTPDSVVRFANDAIGQLLEQLSPEHRDRVAGLGIAIPFRLWDWADALGVRSADMADWRDRDIAEDIGDKWSFPVYLKNDASAACGAELVFGNQDRPPDFLYFFIGFFVGGGLVLDNALYTGRTGNAGAVGSLPINTTTGDRRQLIDVASLATLERVLVEAGTAPDTIWESSRTWSVPEAHCEKWIAEAAEGLASAITSSACLIDFECVVIDGWLPPPVRAELVAQVESCLTRNRVAGIDLPEVRGGTIGGEARALGAASLPLSNRFLVDRNAFLKE
mgnify:CR=1 FL=1|tara:strand:- start:8795 stop:10018 length:1224 start_codon:yes stop_codon:yes gene_type:complete